VACRRILNQFIMKAKHLLLIPIAAALPSLTAFAQDTGNSATATEQTASETTNKSTTGKDQMMSACNSDQTQAELDKLIAEMNSAPAEKKLDAIAAVVTKLAEQFKATQQKEKIADSDKPSMGMCKMMMGIDMKEKGNTNKNNSLPHQH
jgi:hypothetical protein